MKGNFWENFFMAIVACAVLFGTSWAIFATGVFLAETAPSAWSGAYAAVLYLALTAAMVFVARRG